MNVPSARAILLCHLKVHKYNVRYVHPLAVLLGNSFLKLAELQPIEYL